MKRFLRNLLREFRRGAFAIGTGVFLGLIAAFGLVAPVFQKDLVVHATPSDALPPCPEYQALLDQNSNVLWASDPGVTPPVRRPVLSTFDYARLALYPDGKAKLAAVRKELLDIRPSRLGPQARTAWAINTHNFLVIDAIVKYGFPEARPVSSVRDISIGGASLYQAPLAVIEGHSYSLEKFEAMFSSDPRAHFALTTGARGGPPLHPQAYRPETLDAQLDDVTRGALLGSKHLRWNGMSKQLAVSQIFEWHGSDFGGPDSAFAFVLAHIPPRTADQIRAAGIAKIPGFIDCEWTLNQTPSR